MNWDKFYTNVKRFADRAAEKINRTADIATLQVKLSMAQKKLDEAFTVLGKIAYQHFSEETDLSERVAVAMENIKHIQAEISALETQIEDVKKQSESNKQEGKTSASGHTDEYEKAESFRDEQTKQPDSNVTEPISSLSNAEDAVEIDIMTEGGI